MKYSEYSFVFDIDGTICPIKKKDEEYANLIPNVDIVNKMRELHNHGAKIVLYTSRNMNSYDSNLGLINKFTAPILHDWLKKWDIPYDEIVFGKVWPGKKGFYVDDRSIRPSELLQYDLEDWETLCKDSQVKHPEDI